MKKDQKWTIFGGVATILFVIVFWKVSGEVSGELQVHLDRVLYPISFFESSYAYAYLMLASLFFPLILSFDRKVNYVGSWKYLIAVFVWVSSLYIGWDVLFTRWEIWEFNESYISGIRMWGLPIEEISFFLVIPFACIFIYECVSAYNLRSYLGGISMGMIQILFAVGLGFSIYHFGGYYTSTVCIVLSIGWGLVEFRYSKEQKQDIYLSVLLSYIPFLVVNSVLTGSCSEEPIVLYNDAQNLPWRLGSIPLDDTIYQAGMMLWMFMVYIGAKKNKKIFYFF